MRYEEETRPKGYLFPWKPICRTRQTVSRAAAMRKGAGRKRGCELISLWRRR